MTPALLLLGGLWAWAAAAPSTAVDATPGWMGDLAFDSSHDRWLVVSSDGRMRGRVMSADAQPVTPVFDLAGNETAAGLAAYSPAAGRYLVLWSDYAGGARLGGRWVSSEGVPGAPVDVPVDVAGTPLFGVGGDRTAALRYDQARGKFVLVFEHRAPGPHVKLTTIGLDGKRGPIVEVGALAAGGNFGPSVAVNGDKNEYCVAYDQRNGPRWAVSRVDAATLAAGPESSEAGVITNVEMSYDPKTKRYLVVYDLAYGTLRGRFLRSCNLADSAGDFLIMEHQGLGSAAIDPASGRFATIGQDGEDYGNRYSVFTSTGGLVARRNPYSSGRNGNFLPVIRANTNDGTFAAISARDYEVTRLVTGIGGPGDGVDLSPAVPPPPLPASLGWRWLSPGEGGEISGTAKLEGEATADVKAVDVLVNLKKVGSAALVGGHWRYELDSRPYSGATNLSAVVADASGNTGRWSIGVNAKNAPAPPAAPPARNGAAFVRQSAPPVVMRPGQTATVSITLRNSGETAWTAARGFKLGAQSPADNANWRFGRVPAAGTVAPGASYTFIFAVKAPARPGTYDFQWRMSQDRVQWFGQATPLRRIVVRAN